MECPLASLPALAMSKPLFPASKHLLVSFPPFSSPFLQFPDDFFFLASSAIILSCFALKNSVLLPKALHPSH